MFTPWYPAPVVSSTSESTTSGRPTDVRPPIGRIQPHPAQGNAGRELREGEPGPRDVPSGDDLHDRTTGAVEHGEHAGRAPCRPGRRGAPGPGAATDRRHGR